MVKKYYLTSKNGTVFAICFSLCCFALLITFLIHIKEVGFLPLIFMTFVTIFAIFGTLACTTNRIVLDFKNNIIKLCKIKRYKFDLDKLVKIDIVTKNSVDPRKYCHLVFNFIDNKQFTMSGFLSMFKYKDVEKTHQLINRIKADFLIYKKMDIEVQYIK